MSNSTRRPSSRGAAVLLLVDRRAGHHGARRPGDRTARAEPAAIGHAEDDPHRARAGLPALTKENAMIRLLRDMPAGVLGLEAVDDVEKEDYENVLLPAIDAALAEHGKVRLVYVLGREFDDYEGGAIWEDLKLGVRNPTKFERVAVVTDARWAGPAIKVLSVLWPGQARAFPLAELAAAKSWAAEDSD